MKYPGPLAYVSALGLTHLIGVDLAGGPDSTGYRRVRLQGTPYSRKPLSNRERKLQEKNEKKRAKNVPESEITAAMEGAL